MNSEWLERAASVLCCVGRVVFALAIVALGAETIVCARLAGHSLGARYDVIPVLPWLPAIPWLARVFGAIWLTCGLGLLCARLLRRAAMVLGCLLLLCTLIIIVPKYALRPGSISLRTAVFEPIAIASLALLLPGRDAIPKWLERGSRYLLALALMVFGVDHFLALAPIGTLVPSWIPWHVFWIALFGAVFIASGFSIALDWLMRWGTAGIGLMFATWVFTLHLPRVLGLYGIQGAPRNPDEWSSLFIAVALWGGLWTRVKPSFRQCRQGLAK